MIEFSEIVKALGDNYNPKKAYVLIEQGVRGESLSAQRQGYIFQARVTDPQVDDGRVFAIYLREDIRCQPPRYKKPRQISKTSPLKTTLMRELSPNLDPAEKETSTRVCYPFTEVSPDSNTSSAPSNSSDTGKARDGKWYETQTFTPSVVPADSSIVSSSSKGNGSRLATTKPTKESSSSTLTLAESQA